MQPAGVPQGSDSAVGPKWHGSSFGSPVCSEAAATKKRIYWLLKEVWD